MEKVRMGEPGRSRAREITLTQPSPGLPGEGKKWLRAVVEGLELRRLLSGGTPVVHALRFASKGRKIVGEVAADVIYGVLNGVGQSSKALAVGAKAVAPFSVNADAIKAALAGAPMEWVREAASRAIVLPLPTPDGGISRFKVVEAPIMSPELAAKFPEIKTYRGVGIDDPTASLRLDYTPLGMHAQVLSVEGAYYIDPYFRNDGSGIYASYFKRDIASDVTWTCGVGADPALTPALSRSTGRGGESVALAADGPLAPTFGTQLKTYRLACAADGEYVAAVGGGTVAGGQAAVVTAINRVTGVYETELGIRLTLVANNSSLIYTNASTDPYTNTNPSSLLTQNQSNIDSVIGNANYDIGHVFTTGGGGLAALGVVGKTGLKAQAETGTSNPTGDAFYIDYVAHEMGHQFGANHTFNTANDTANRNASTAYEPGSGSTIMAYAGIEGTEDLQAHSDPYFHSASIDEIRTYITSGTIATVGTTTSTGNNGPTVSAGLSYTIPTGTPFVLTATGSDPDGDVLTYDWQERDLGVATLLTTADNGTSPILRDWVPSTSPSRIVPRLSNLLNNTLAPGEKLPAVARASFKWRVIARDNRAGGGGVASSDVTLAVVNTGSAFAVTAPNTAVSWFSGQNQSVTWNVAGTTANGINTANVSILLSTDGGNTYPITLAASTANDGTESIVVPNNLTSSARIKVQAVGNIYFDISNVNFTISDGTPPPGSIAGQTFEDRNADGAFNGNDVGKNGVVVYLDNNNNGVLDGGEPNVTTSGSGNYSFASLAPGTYHLREQISGFVATAPSGGAIDVVVTSGNASTQNFFNFPIVYSGTSGADDYLVRLSPIGGTSQLYADNFNRAALAGGSNAYTTTVTAGDGGASIVGNILTLTNDASATANANGAVYVTTPTSAFPGFNQQLSANSGVLTWSFNLQQIRGNPSGFALTNYGVACVLGATSGVLNGGGSGNGYAVVMGNVGAPDPIRLVKFANGLTGTLTNLAQTAADGTNHYWSIQVSYDPATNQWSMFTRDDGTSAFADPLVGGGFTQAGSTVADSTYTGAGTPLTHSGAYWAYSTSANQTALFDNFNLALPSGAGPQRLEILVGGIVTYSAPPTLPPSLAFNLGDGNDVFALDSSNGTISTPVSFSGQNGTDTWRFVGASHSISGDASALAENIELTSGASLSLSATQNLGAFNIDSTSSAALGANGSRVFKVNSLSIAAGGALDLNDNDLIVNNGGYVYIQSLVDQGFQSTSGIISSTSDGTQVLALFDNTYVGASAWQGISIASNAIVGKYTYLGDVNFDGEVSGDDYGVIDGHLNTTPPVGYGWLSGDANMDGVVTGDDYGVIDAHLGLGAGSPLGPALPRRRAIDELDLLLAL